MSKILFLFGFLFVLIATSKAQQGVLDGAYARETQVKRIEIPLQHIREIDAMYSKKVLRGIDMDEKRNHPLYFPIDDVEYPAAEGLQPERKRLSLASLVFNAAYPVDKNMSPTYNGRLIYAPYDQTNLTRLTEWWLDPVYDSIQVGNAFNVIKKQRRTLDAGTPMERDTIIDIPSRIQPKDVKSIYIWEEWVFDKQRSLMDVRVISILFTAELEDQTALLFWIAYDDYKDLFATHEVYNQSGNDGARLSFYDIFQKRLFSSYILAETNVYDNRNVNDYLLGIDAIREGERIQGQIFTYEHDQWEY
jgi:gliding motility associated protien GldN